MKLMQSSWQLTENHSNWVPQVQVLSRPKSSKTLKFQDIPKIVISLQSQLDSSKPIIQPMYCSSIASRNGRFSRRLSILSTDGMATLFLSSNASVPLTLQWFLNFYFQRLLGQSSESLLSKHSTCVSRTYSQPQPVEIFSMLISRQVVGVFTVQKPHLCLQDLLPTSACRDILSIPKPCHLRQSIDKSPSTNDLTVIMSQKMKWNKTHITWIKNTQALRCPWLYINNVPT